jgi:SAM-dependent methyltransferase
VTIASFYDALAPWYHAIYADWDASMARQGETLNELVAENWGLGPKIIVDASAGIGTQAIPLAGCGHRVVASDLSARAITRAQTEAAGRELQLPAYRGDMQALPIGTGVVDIVMTCDNSLPHLLTEAAIQRALREFSRCVRPGADVWSRCAITRNSRPRRAHARFGPMACGSWMAGNMNCARSGNGMVPVTISPSRFELRIRSNSC